jgi:hypothetical protein
MGDFFRFLALGFARIGKNFAYQRDLLGIALELADCFCEFEILEMKITALRAEAVAFLDTEHE